MRTKELGVAIVGSGRMGELRAHTAATHAAVRFLACSDSDPARAKHVADKVGAQLHSGDNRAVIAHPEVDAVIISTPNHSHVEPILQAIDLGKAILCEKPIALTLEDARIVMDAIRRKGADVRYGYSQRFKERNLHAKEQVRQGRLG